MPEKHYRYRVWRSNFDDQTTDSGGESQPLLSSDNSSASYAVPICMFPDSETSDMEAASNTNNRERCRELSNKSAYNNRRPFHYHTGRRLAGDIDGMSAATYNRFQYYSKLRATAPEEDNTLVIPDHVVPASFFVPYIPGTAHEPGKQGSIVTIFAIWNTIMGSSLLSMPWGVERAGLGGGLLLMIGMSSLCLYTSWRLLRVNAKHGSVHGEVADLARSLLGWPAEIAAKVFSLVVLLGANVIYWVLMSNFLYFSVDYFYLLCPRLTPPSNLSLLDETPGDQLYHRLWGMDTTVPLVLIPFLAPLISCRSAIFFTKFNSLGTLSVLYLVIFLIVKGVTWGINADPWTPTSPAYTPTFLPSFPALSGMLALSFFIHNIIITIMRNNRNPEHNGRDLSIAFVLVTMTYITIGFLFYVTFPLAKSCIEDNILNNFPGWDPLAVAARLFLLFQLVTVFPLVAYMLRVQVFAALRLPPGALQDRLPTFALNVCIVCTCVLFAVFLPHIGTIIRYTGAISGLVHVFSLPCVLHMVSLYRDNRLTVLQVLLHSSIIAVGSSNLVAQFFVSEN
ncbi:hypothetical protein B566_EDAN001890 [Ephemera danica]|nr:hypothetical protein B566_EDAN001890 [Ephemera danica]